MSLVKGEKHACGVVSAVLYLVRTPELSRLPRLALDIDISSGVVGRGSWAQRILSEETKHAFVEAAFEGLTICAERTAIVKAVGDGVKSFAALAIVARSRSLKLTVLRVTRPACAQEHAARQVSGEFCAPDMPVILVPEGY
ncbi:hypothetical protein B0H14DRAFT_2632337 [Mycena olivaceomarginata]|nr:hypothetical protein B0H14DRAFT_2632337 [Mycena olivaceomarginata]